MLTQKAATRLDPYSLTPRQRYAHLRVNERRALEEYLAQLRTKFGNQIQHVILYGSRARLEGDDESDLDVLLVIDADDRDLESEVALATFEPSLRHSALISPLIWDKAHYELHQRLRLLIYRNIEKDGIELWTN